MSSSVFNISGMKSLRISIRLECSAFFERVDELAVRALQIAFDHVVLEVVDGLGLVGGVGVVAASSRAAGGLCRHPAAASGQCTTRGAHERDAPEDGKSDDEFLHDSVSFKCRERGRWTFRQPRAPRVPKNLPDPTTLRLRWVSPAAPPNAKAAEL